MIPIVFKAKFEGTAIKHNLDKRILAAEAPGVLRWIFEGCLKWQRDGRLIVPASIEAERAGYRKETDILGQWIAERCRSLELAAHLAQEIGRLAGQTLDALAINVPSQILGRIWQ